MAHRVHSSRGFSVPEVLAVVAVITIIMSILMPNLGRGRDVARKVVCASNLHQQGLAMINYTVETRHYPGHAAASQHGKVMGVWPTRVRVFTRDIGVFNCPSAPAGFQWKEIFGAPGGVYATQDDVTRWNYKLGERLLIVGGGEGMPFTYGYNDWGSGNGAGNVILTNPQRGLGGDLNFSFNQPELKKYKVVAPSDMIAISDNVNDGNWDYNIDPWNPTEGVGKLHFEGANTLFCDGHTEWELQSKWMNVQHSTQAGKDMAKRWNNHNKETGDQGP
jgi:prepilin-type N-terminal cleavage/methylation domain-containing protein/prepilin-type processing-associated H-X9-DG protein